MATCSRTTLGYLILAENYHKIIKLFQHHLILVPCESNRSVKDLVNECLKHWDGEFTTENNNDNSPHEAGVLNLTIEKAIKELSWHPKWNFNTTIKKTINWYKDVFNSKKNPIDCTLKDLNDYLTD